VLTFPADVSTAGRLGVIVQRKQARVTRLPHRDWLTGWRWKDGTRTALALSHFHPHSPRAFVLDPVSAVPFKSFKPYESLVPWSRAEACIWNGSH